VRHDWNRSLSAERRQAPQTHPIEDLVITATILVGIVCTIWFLLFGSPGVPQT
jgi:predicted secreted protein